MLQTRKESKNSKPYDLRYPSIELATEVIVGRDRLFSTALSRQIKKNTLVTYCGKLIGIIDKVHVDRWDSRQYSASFYKSDADERGEYVDRFNCLYAAKLGVFKAWREKAVPEKRKFDPALLPSGDNSDFYPTPSGLAGKMMAMVDWKTVTSVLEPSAGKGDLLECMGSVSYGRIRCSRELKDIDCIESDQNLRYILAGKGYRVVHDDFLTFHTHKRYDLIMMNPPFSEGDRHLEKALEIQQDGGQVVCLLNAETLHNPYTLIRKHLAERLAKLGARIQYVQGAFLRAERKSDVEVAIVTVNIPRHEYESGIFERMKKAAEQKVETDAPRELIGGGYVEQMVTAYGVEVAATLEFVREYNSIVPYILHGGASYKHALISVKIGDHAYEKVDNEGINRYMRAVRGKYWDRLFHLPQLTNRFTSNLMKDYQSSIDRMENYDFSEFNIRQVIDELNGSLRTGVDQAIMDLFETLSATHSWYPESKNNIHYYSGWATNKAHKVNKKVIIPIHGAHSDASWKSEKLDQYRIYSVLGDIEKALDYLDRGVTADSDMSRVLAAANAAGQTRGIVFKYFTATFYKKGTCHIVFHDQRVVDLLNIYAARGRNWLPPNYGKVHYSDLSEEARAVVDDFQGEEAYEKIVRESQYYLADMTMPLLSPAG